MSDRAIQNAEAEADHLAALARAEQAVIDSAYWAVDGYMEWNDLAVVPLGRIQDLETALDEWRALGGKTTEEHVANAVVPVDFSYAPWE